jgi:hypothetical protein
MHQFQLPIVTSLHLQISGLSFFHQFLFENEAIVLESFHSDFWHGKHVFFRTFGK